MRDLGGNEGISIFFDRNFKGWAKASEDADKFWQQADARKRH